MIVMFQVEIGDDVWKDTGLTCAPEDVSRLTLTLMRAFPHHMLRIDMRREAVDDQIDAEAADAKVENEQRREQQLEADITDVVERVKAGEQVVIEATPDVIEEINRRVGIGAEGEEVVCRECGDPACDFECERLRTEREG